VLGLRRDEHVVAGPARGVTELGERPDVAGAAAGREQDAHAPGAWCYAAYA